MKKLTAANIKSIRARALELYKDMAPYDHTDSQLNLSAVYTRAVLDELEVEGLLPRTDIDKKDPYDGPNS